MTQGSRQRWSIPVEAEEHVPPSGPPGQEFLFHLYRGSELLKENLVDEAKSELERALSLQPRDVEGQSLLGIVYFRLGHYPRAIQIYEELVRSRPEEIAPKVNLALCHMKTGQLQTARLLLEEVVQLRPEHVRAWGYLGLTFQRLGDNDKACVAFDRAGRPQLAERLRHPADNPGQPPAHQVEEIGQGESPRLLASDFPPAGLGVPSVAPRAPLSVSFPPASSAPIAIGHFAARAAAVLPERPGVVAAPNAGILVRIEGVFFLRADSIVAWTAEQGPFKKDRVPRQSRQGPLDVPLGGHAHPVVRLEGHGSVLVRAPDALVATPVQLDDDPLYVREDHLAGFDQGITYLNGKLPLGVHEEVPLVQLSGIGIVVLLVPERITSVAVDALRPLSCHAERVLGWVGRLFPRPVPDEEGLGATVPLVAFSGEGRVLIDAC